MSSTFRVHTLTDWEMKQLAQYIHVACVPHSEIGMGVNMDYFEWCTKRSMMYLINPCVVHLVVRCNKGGGQGVSLAKAALLLKELSYKRWLPGNELLRVWTRCFLCPCPALRQKEIKVDVEDSHNVGLTGISFVSTYASICQS